MTKKATQGHAKSEATKQNSLPIDGVINCLQFQSRLLTYLIENQNAARHVVELRDATDELCDKVLYFRLLNGLKDNPNFQMEIDRIREKFKQDTLGEYDSYQHGFLEGKLAGFPFAFPELWESSQR